MSPTIVMPPGIHCPAHQFAMVKLRHRAVAVQEACNNVITASALTP